MTSTIRRHPLIKSDMDDIFNFIADFAGFDLAETKVSQINKRIETLVDFAEIGTVRDQIHPDLHVLTAAGQDVVCFTVDREAEKVFVVLVTDAGEDWT